jgi:ferredoxin
MRVLVDRATCEGNAMCMGVAPAVFQVKDDDSKVTILEESPPEDRRATVEDAVRACPTQALSVEG